MFRIRETGHRWPLARPISPSAQLPRAVTRNGTRRVTHAAALGIAALAVSATAATVAAPSASADPALTIAEAKQQIAQLESDSEALDQQWLSVEQQIETTKSNVAQRKSDLKKQATKVAQLRTQFSQLALAEYQNRNVDTRAQLFMTRDTQGFLSQISTVQKVSDNQNAALQNLQAQQGSLTALQRAEAADLPGLKTNEQKLITLRAESDTKLKDAKAVLAQLSEQQRQKLEAERSKQEAAAQREAEETATTGIEGTANGRTGTAGEGSETGSGKGAEALAFARKQLGKPYRFGAVGPAAYDCSGLTLAAWRSAGVGLDRTSEAQFSDGKSVAKSDLQPGDLVFYYSGISHVALYAGNGQIIHAPNSRSVVRYAALDSMPFAGARRPG